MKITKSDLLEFDCNSIDPKIDPEIFLDLVTTKYKIRYRGSWELFIIFSPKTYSMNYHNRNLEEVIKRLKEIVFCE